MWTAFTTLEVPSGRLRCATDGQGLPTLRFGDPVRGAPTSVKAAPPLRGYRLFFFQLVKELNRMKEVQINSHHNL